MPLASTSTTQCGVHAYWDAGTQDLLSEFTIYTGKYAWYLHDPEGGGNFINSWTNIDNLYIQFYKLRFD